MKLLHSATSPYVRKVSVTAHEKGLIDQIEVVAVNSMQEDAVLLAANPLSKVPALVFDDGSAMFDSPLLCEYLDSLGDAPKLIPESGADRWAVLRHQATTDGLLDAAFGFVMENRRPESERSAMWMERWLNAINRSLDVMEAEIDSFGEVLTLAHISLGCALGYLDLRYKGIVDWRDAHPKLSAWYEVFASRPSMQATVPPS